MVELLPLSDIAPQAVEALLDAAFGADRFGRTAYRIRQGMDAIPRLSFAAVEDGALIGTIQCWPVAHRTADGAVTPLVMVGPVAVRPDLQRGGHGRVLMTHMLTAAEDGADGALMMIGDPEYYGRFFGFDADATAAWDLPGPFEQRRLLARAVNGHALPMGAGMIGPR
ncbi:MULTISPECIES: GNAT family N-acetyltransferase [unclassified Sphingopyxis]|uniref:GNAT family N-acetyltransferase n=1 Tax=unclassified Sphingopyxis TaxID=2614943 RepID=UPI0025EC98E7|nr:MULTISPECIES: N-acetyltransferase [unclassified Sphingopyxis]